MGFNVSKPKPTTPKLVESKSSSLENIADEYMKRDSYKRSQTKYGVNLQDDEFAEDVPLEMPRSGNSTPINRSLELSVRSPTEAWRESPNSTPKSSQTKETKALEHSPSATHFPIKDDELWEDGYYTQKEKEKFEEPLPPLEHSETEIEWQKGGLIGSGAFGKVYLGLNLGTGELLAVKQVELTGDHLQQQREVESFKQEVDLMRCLKHVNIVQYWGTCIEDNYLNIFLEFVPGGSISSLLAKFGPFNEAVIRAYTRQILLGLEYLHRHHIIHRDIKGANILVSQEGVVKLADFGASKRLSGLVSMNGAMSLKGTPYYMAPEVIKQTGHGRQVDIWSVGCTVYEMFTGKPPWHEMHDQVSAMFKIVNSTTPPPFPESVSDDAKEFLLACFQRDPKDRPNASRLLTEFNFNKPPAVRTEVNRSGNTSKMNSPVNSNMGTPRLSPKAKDGPVGGAFSGTSTPKNHPTAPFSNSKVAPASPVPVPVPLSPEPSRQRSSSTSSTSGVEYIGNPIEEPSIAWGNDSDHQGRNINWVETKLKNASSDGNSPIHSPKLSQRRRPSISEGKVSMSREHLKEEPNNHRTSQSKEKMKKKQPKKRREDSPVNEHMITDFVRQSALTSTKMLAQGPLLQSLKDFSIMKGNRYDDEEIINTLLKRAERTRKAALANSEKGINEDYDWQKEFELELAISRATSSEKKNDASK